MKIFLAAIFIYASFFSYSQTITDTTIQGILVSFRYSATIFPADWQISPISATGEAISSSEISRSKSIMIKALKKYPASAIQKDLQAVYFLKSMNFYHVGYGGTNSTGAVYLTNNGVPDGYTDIYLEQTFHHEYSSILFRNHIGFFDEAGWKNANIPAFDYNDPEAGVGAIRKNKSSQDLDTVLCAKGFLTEYSLSGMENDINTIAQNIFSPSQNFWLYADRYPRINKKIKLLISFYNKIDPVFTELYFRNLAR
ncbi:MAG: hypothetical protein ABIU11_02055 [Chitinophagaceae bacterium]